MTIMRKPKIEITKTCWKYQALHLIYNWDVERDGIPSEGFPARIYPQGSRFSLRGYWDGFNGI